MKILGVRSSPTKIRYAIVESINGTYSLLNAATESGLAKPATIVEISLHLRWAKEELHRVIRQSQPIDLIALKTSEYVGSTTKLKRTGDYFDAIVLLVAAELNIPVQSRLYSQSGTTRKDVKTHAELRVGRTSTGWDIQMADAVAVAWAAEKL